MPATDSTLNKSSLGAAICGTRWSVLLMLPLWLSLALTGCRDQATAVPREVIIQQAWELEPGDNIAGFRVTASLGDISIKLENAAVRAPFEGEVEPAASLPDCVYFSSPEVPAYLFRYCGLHHPRLGSIQANQTMGKARLLHFATLRRQPEGTWAIVEPSSHVLERSLTSRP